MEFNFSVFRVVLLISLIAVFYCLGGFDVPSLPDDSILSQRRVTKSWFFCVLFFLSGAVSTSIVDHFVGSIDRSNLRFLYIGVGVIVMAGSTFYIRSLNDAAEVTNSQSENLAT